MFHSSQLLQALQVEEFDEGRRIEQLFRFFDCCGRGRPDMLESDSLLLAASIGDTSLRSIHGDSTSDQLGPHPSSQPTVAHSAR
jgi:hypothetical protein